MKEVMSDSSLWMLEINGILLTPLMARNALRSNVTWTSYPFIPPTGTSGFFAELVNGEKWYERNDGCVRHLDDLAEWKGIFAVGAYPLNGQMSQRHFRSHLGDSFNYESYVWTVGKKEGKKLAVIEEFLTDGLRFVLVSQEPDALNRLYYSVRGRIAPIAKKGSVQLEFNAQPSLIHLEHQMADGNEETLTIMPLQEIGKLPKALPYLVPLRSNGDGKKDVSWHIQHCAWEQGLLFRQGIEIYAGEYNNKSAGISAALLQSIGIDTNQ